MCATTTATVRKDKNLPYHTHRLLSIESGHGSSVEILVAGVQELLVEELIPLHGRAGTVGVGVEGEEEICWLLSGGFRCSIGVTLSARYVS